MVGPEQPHLFADIRKSRSVVAEKMIIFSRLDNVQAFDGMGNDVIELTILLLDGRDAFVEGDLDTQPLGSRRKMGFAIGD